MSWPTVPVKRWIRPVPVPTNLIKGQVCVEPAEGLVPGYSASGQDVWLEHNQARLSGPALVLSAVGARCGKVFMADHARWGVVANTAVLRVADTCDLRFAWYLTNAEAFWQKGGAAQPYIRIEESLQRRIPLPPLEEQRRIADFLDAETRRIDEVRLARARMQELLRLKRERVIEHLIGDQEDSRTFVPLKHLVESVTVGIVITPAAWYVDNGGVPALRGVNVKPGRIDDKDLVQISHEGHLVHRKSRLRVGDLVVVRTGQAGAAAVVTNDFDGANCIDLVIVRPGVALAPRFAEYLLNSSYAKRRVAEFAVGSIQSHFNVAAMRAMPVPRRSLADQHRIVAEIDRAVGPIERTVGEMQKQDELLAERRQALISAAVTGEIDVTRARGAGV